MKEYDKDRRAKDPTEFTGNGWWAVCKRVFGQIGDDHVQIVSAGIAFYLFLSIFPAIAAIISVYGLVVSPTQAEQHIAELASMLPSDVHSMVSDITAQIAAKSGESLGVGLGIGILLSLWSANKGTKALFEGLNIVYDETDDRGFIKSLLLTYGFTAVMIVAGVSSLILVAVVPIVLETLGLGETVSIAVSILRWPLIAGIFALLLSFAYKVAPDRDRPSWGWVSWGSVIATLLWIGGSALFSWYVNSFGSFGETYGSFAAVVILMLWFFISAFLILIGGEFNAEMEHQTSKDTTVGESEPMGQRGAYHADHVADDPR